MNQTFATASNTPTAGVSLFRASHEHGGMACAACHGSAHGEWSSSSANENVQAEQLQGSKGTLMVCTACHTSGSDSVTGGPHGMHDIGQRWTEKHHDLMGDEDSGAALACRTCHGADYRGTALSRSGFDQTLSGRGQRHFWQGFQIGCYNCHLTPLSSTGNTNPPASAADLEMNTVSATPASVQLQAVSSRGRALSYRLIDRPAHGMSLALGVSETWQHVIGHSQEAMSCTLAGF